MFPTEDYAPGASAFSLAQVELYERSGGREGNTVEGCRVVILTCLGARTGKLRKTPVMRVEDQGRYLLVASLAGADQHPAWYTNLKRNAAAHIHDGLVHQDVLTRELHGDERARWWDRAITVWPAYEHYQGRTARAFPLLLAELNEGPYSVARAGRPPASSAV